MTDRDRLEILGAPGSPYTRKMLALLRYRRIPHNMIWGGHMNPPEGYPKPKVSLLPTVYFRNASGELEAKVDSTPIIRQLEKMHGARSVIPDNPELAFYNELLEDYGDEWLTKAMFHYRWYHEADRKNAGPLLMYWSNNTAPAETAKQMSDYFTDRQFNRLYVVGSNDITAKTIEDSYRRFIDILDALLQIKGYVLGARPSSADFAIYGQLTQLGQVEPTSAKIMGQNSPRVRAWLDRIEDLSGLAPEADDWFTPPEAREALKPLIEEVGRVYVPFLLANHDALAQGNDQVETEIDGRPWSQPSFPYQGKCLDALRAAFTSLPDADQASVRRTLSGTGCEPLLAQN